MARRRVQQVRVTLTIGLQYPIEMIGRGNLKSLIEDAVRSWGGSLHPDDYLFDAVSRVQTGRVEVVK